MLMTARKRTRRIRRFVDMTGLRALGGYVKTVACSNQRLSISARRKASTRA
jgi:hypothetical protein